MPRTRTRDTARSITPAKPARVRESRVAYGWTPCGFASIDTARLDVGSPRPRQKRGALGLRFQDHAHIVEEIRKGFRFTAFERLCREMRLSIYEVAEIASIARRTLARRKREGRLRALESEKVFRIAFLFDRAVEVLGGEEHARQWITSPSMSLRGQTPFRHAETEVGAREVEDLLGRLEHGVFS